MMGEHLPHGDAVVRYIKGCDLLEDGKTVAGDAFTLRASRPDETGISVNWLGYFSTADKDSRLSMVRQSFQLKTSRSARFGELIVGETIEYLKIHGYNIAFQHFPKFDESGNPIDPSHSEITQIPPAGDLDAAVVGYLIAKCVNGLHPAKLQ